jgi:hypothetical protein
MSRTVDIVAVEDTPHDNGFDWLNAFFRPGNLNVTSVNDMVTKVLAQSGGRPIRSLYIIGHAAPGDQSVGAGQAVDSTGTKTLVIDPSTGQLAGNAEAELARLVGHFAPGAVVTLGGCEVAKGSAGQALLQRVSTVLGGIPVDGGDRLQRLTPGMEGNVIRCEGQTCRVYSKAWF